MAMLAARSVHRFGSDLTIPTSTEWFAKEFGPGTHVPSRNFFYDLSQSMIPLLEYKPSEG